MYMAYEAIWFESSMVSQCLKVEAKSSKHSCYWSFIIRR